MRFSHFLITRPEPEASRLAARLAGSGLIPIVMPAFSFHAVDNRVRADPAWRKADHKLAVFTSVRAVEFGLLCVDEDLLDGASIAAIGPATAGALKKAGYRVACLPQTGHNSESLLLLDGLREDPGEAILFTAPGGRMALAEGLGQRDWGVRVEYVYKRELHRPLEVEITTIEEAGPVLSVWTSGTALNWLSSCLAGTAWTRITAGEFLVISDRLRELAMQHGAKRVHQSAGPGNDAIYESVANIAGLGPAK